MEETKQLCSQLESGELLARDEQLRIYRKVLAEARRSDLELDKSERALLSVLRRELKIRRVEHYLLEHHVDLQEFWNNEHCYLHELNALRSSGLVFVRNGQTLLAEDTVELLRDALGLEMSRPSMRQLFEKLLLQDLGEALQKIGCRTAGTKDEKIERLLRHLASPGEVLACASMSVLRDLCRELDLAVSGTKEELVVRIVGCFSRGAHERPVEAPPAAPPAEPRTLDEDRFVALFRSLRSAELHTITKTLDGVRQTGTKDVRVGVLLQTRFSETTLLERLSGRLLEEILDRHRLKLGGSKADRVQRIIEFYQKLPKEMIEQMLTAKDTETPEESPVDAQK